MNKCVHKARKKNTQPKFKYVINDHQRIKLNTDCLDYFLGTKILSVIPDVGTSATNAMLVVGCGEVDINLLKPTGYVMHQQFNLLKTTGHVMHQEFKREERWVQLLSTLWLFKKKQFLPYSYCRFIKGMSKTLQNTLQNS